MIKITHFFRGGEGVFDLRRAAVFEAQIAFSVMWVAGLFMASVDGQPSMTLAVSILFFALQICVFFVAFLRNWVGLLAFSIAGFSAAFIQIIRAAG